MSVPLFMLKFTVKKVLGDLFSGADRAKNAVDYDKTRDLDKFSEKEVELEELPNNDFNKDDYQSRLDSLFIKGESTNLIEALEGTSKMNLDLMSDVVNSVDSKMKVMGENLEKVKDVAETGSNLSNLNLQTSMNSAKAAGKGGIIEGVKNIISGLGDGIISAIGLALNGLGQVFDEIKDGVKRLEDKLIYGNTKADDNPAPAASEETIEDRNKALENIASTVNAESAAVESYVEENIQNGTFAGPQEGTEREWLANWDEEHGIERPVELTDAEVKSEIALIKEQNLSTFDWQAQGVGVTEVQNKYEPKKTRDNKYYELTNALALNESQLEVNKKLNDTLNPFTLESNSTLNRYISSLTKGKIPFSWHIKKDDFLNRAKKVKELVLSDENLKEVFTGEGSEIGLKADDSELKFLGEALKHSDSNRYLENSVSSVDARGNYNLGLEDQVLSQQPISRGDAIVLDKKGNVVSDYSFLTDGTISNSDVANYEILSDSTNSIYDLIGHEDIKFNATKDNLQVMLEQVIQRNKDFENLDVDIFKIMDYIDSNDGKLDSYLYLMTEAVKGGFASVASLVSNIVKESGTDNVIIVPTDTD